VTTLSPVGALLGLGVAIGLLVVARHAPVLRRVRLDDRIAPYLRDPRDDLRRVRLAQPTRTPFPTLERLLRPSLARAAARLERVLGGGTSVRRRLEQAGSELSLEDFRVQQLVWGCAGFGAAAGLSLLLITTGRAASPVLLLVACVAGAAAGVVLRDQRLSGQVRRRQERMLAEFPTTADLLALAVAAGEGPAAALERVTRTGHGELAREFERCLADTRAGTPLVAALDRTADRTSLPALARFVDGMVVALERGTPLADVLRAQAADVRDMRKRMLLESGGRREIGMMVPVVFCVLPTTILFALFPGLVQIQLLVG
jgi:tight adherence protein C